MAAEETATLTQDAVYEALEEVIDPELGLDFVSLGLVYDVEIQGSDVYVTFTLTYPGLPDRAAGRRADEGVRRRDSTASRGVYPKMVFDPPWSPEMMSEDAKFALGF